MNEYLKFIRFLKPHSGILGLAVVFMALSSLFDWVSIAMIVPVVDKVFNKGTIIFPVKMPPAIDSIVRSINAVPQLELLNYLMIVIPILFLFKGIFNFLYSYYMSDIGQLCVRDIRDRLYEKIQSLSLEYFTQKRAGELISRITNDVKVVENALSYGTTDLFYQSFLVVAFSVTIFFIHWKLALISFLLVPLLIFPIVKVGKILRKISKTSQEKMADINSLLIETISGIRIVKAFNMENGEINKFRAHNQRYYKLSMKAIKRTLLLGPATELLGVIFAVLILAWVGKDVIAGKISFGVFMLFLGSLFSLIRPIKKLSQVNSLNQQAMAANNRIYEILDCIPTVIEKQPGSRILPGFNRDILFDHVCFKHGDALILNDIVLEVKKGQIIAIVGPSGAGKTTLVDLIPRFYDPCEGRILIDGDDIKEFSLSSLRRHIGIVTQETILFNETIKKNIAYGKTDASDEEIEEAAKKAYAYDFIKRFPQGFDTVIGDRGMKMSGGERQRIAIARAILKNPPILILDEATSQLDTQSERIVQDALNKLVEGRTVFVIAHRLSTIRSAHRIVVVESGKIVESGLHEELLNKNGLYKNLYMNQRIQ